MQFIRFYACDQNSGATLPGASVAVFSAGGTTSAQLYDISGAEIANPVIADNQGRVGYAAANGDYDVVTTSQGMAQPTMRQYLFDPADTGGTAANTQNVGSLTAEEVVAQLEAAGANISTAQAQIAEAEVTLNDLTGESGTIAQINAQIEAIENDVADSPAVLEAQAAEAGALSAESTAEFWSGQAENYSNSAITSEGLATEAANGAANSLYDATQAAGSAAGSATAAASSLLAAQVTGAATLPSTMAVPGFFTPSETAWPGQPFAANDPGFVTAADGTPVYRNAPDAADTVCSWGAITPVVGRTYQVTATGRIKTAPTNGRPAIFQVGLLGLRSDGSGNIGYYADAPDVSATPAGTLITSTVSHLYAGVTPQSAYKSRVLINFDGADGDAETGVFSDAVFELISLQLEDITESTAAAGSATAALTSEQSASASSTSAGAYQSEAQEAESLAAQAQSAAGQSASAAAGSESSAQAEAGDASGSATAAQGYALEAQGYQGSAQSFASEAQGYAASASGSEASAASSAALVANYSPGTNDVPNPSFSQGSVGWTFANGSTLGSDPFGGTYLYHPTYNADLHTSYYLLGYSAIIPCGQGLPCSIQARIYSGGLGSSNSYARCGVNFFNASNQVIGYACAQTNIRQSWVRYLRDANNGGAITTPEGTAGYQVVLDLDSSSGDLIGSGDNIAFTSIKVEFNSAVCTPFTDDQIGASLTSVSVAAASATEAVASDVSNLTADYDGTSATVSENEAAISLLNGQVTGMLKFSVNAGGQTVGLELLAASGGSTNLSALEITAEQLLFTTPGGALLFGVDGDTGEVYLQNAVVAGNLVVNGTIDTPQLAAGAVTSLSYGLSNATTSIYVSGSSAPVTSPPPTGTGGGGSGNRNQN